MAEDWTNEEVRLIVEQYFNMLQLELSNQKYNKTSNRQSLLHLLNDRSESAIEFKHQNISAVLAKMGLPFIKGYKQRGHYQDLLEQEVASYIQQHRIRLEERFAAFSDKTVAMPYDAVNFEKIIDSPPESSGVEENEPTYRPIKINYLQREQNNRRLGEEGEKLVIAYEQFRLRKEGKEHLADKIEWVAKEKGDGAGFDILSKNINGTDRYVEVKTTKLSKETPIYLTRTEVSFASNKAADFYLYRVFNFDSNPQLFIRNGHYGSFCVLQPDTYKGIF